VLKGVNSTFGASGATAAGNGTLAPWGKAGVAISTPMVGIGRPIGPGGNCGGSVCGIIEPTGGTAGSGGPLQKNSQLTTCYNRAFVLTLALNGDLGGGRVELVVIGFGVVVPAGSKWRKRSSD